MAAWYDIAALVVVSIFCVISGWRLILSLRELRATTQRPRMDLVCNEIQGRADKQAPLSDKFPNSRPHD